MKDELRYEYSPRSIGMGYAVEGVAHAVERITETDVLNHMAREVQACNQVKGWYDVNPRVDLFMEWWDNSGFGADKEDLGTVREMIIEMFGARTFGDDIALLHSEVSEMLEAFRAGGLEDQTSELTYTDGRPAKPEGVGSEAADVLVRLLDTCSRYGIDLFHEWRRKVDFNWTRPTRHGGKAL